MTNTITLTDEQIKALQSGQSITIEPRKPAITKWEPKPGAFTIDLVSLISYEALSTNAYRLAGVEYQTQSQADSAAKQLRAYARQLAYLAENDDVWIADWSDADQAKYFVYVRNEVKVDRNYTEPYIGIIYMSQANAEKLAQLMNDGIVEF